MLSVGSAALPTVIGLGILANIGIVAGLILLVAFRASS